MSYKMIVLDLDDTLLKNDGTISRKTKKTLKKAQEDSYNDITMIQAAGLGVAMGNAVETVKEIANYITEDNEHDGVAAVVEKFIWEQAFALIA